MIAAHDNGSRAPRAGGHGAVGVVVPLVLCLCALTGCQTATLKFSLGFNGVMAGVEIDPIARRMPPPVEVREVAK